MVRAIHQCPERERLVRPPRYTRKGSAKDMITVKVRLKMNDGSTRIVNAKRNGTFGKDGKVFSAPVSDSTVKRIDVVVIDDGFGEPVPGKPGLRSYSRKVRLIS